MVLFILGDDMTTGQLIRKARKAAGMTQAELAQALNIPFQSISQWERDIRNPKQESLQRIADALSVQIIDLVPEPILNSFFEGYNRLLHTQRYKNAQSEEDAEDAEYDAINIFWYFDKLDKFGQQRAIACARALAGYEPLDDKTAPPHAIDLAITALCMLNDDGQTKAVERIQELTEIPKYQNGKTPIRDIDFDPLEDLDD